MSLKRWIFIKLFFLALLLLLPIRSQAVVTGDLIVHVETIQSVNRTWDDLTLLYPNQYHNSTEIIEEITYIEASVSELVDVSVIGQSVQGKNIQLVRITNEANENPKAGVFFVAQHHAREEITVEMSLRFMLYLINNYGEDETITRYVDTEEIYIIPTLDPDGNDIVVDQGNDWLRKNLRPFDDDGDGLFDEDPIEDVDGDGKIYGLEIYEKPYPTWDLIDSGFSAYPIEMIIEGIDNDSDGLVNEDVQGFADLNRNYDSYWNDTSFTSGWGSDTRGETYPGTAPFSEPETAALRDFVLQHNFAAAISLHSGINETYFPVFANNYYVEPLLYNQLYYNLKVILPDRFTRIGNNQINKKIATSTAGEWSLWMHEEAGCKVPMTFEIYQNTSSLEEDVCYFLIEENDSHQIWNWTGIYEYFTPDESAANFNSLWEDISPVFTYWLELTPRLEITVESATISSSDTSNVITLEVSIENLSPFLDTIEMIDFRDENFESLTHNGIPVKTVVVLPLYTRSETLEIDLPQLQPGSSLIIMIGNDYTGYQRVIIEQQEDTHTMKSSSTSQSGTSSSSVPNGTPGLMISSVLIILPLIVIRRVRRKS